MLEDRGSFFISLSRLIDVIEVRPICSRFDLSLRQIELISMTFPCMRIFSIAERLKFFHQIHASVMPVSGRGKLECETRRPIPNDAWVVAFQVLQNPRLNILRRTDINPKGAEESVDPGGFGCVPQDRFTLKQELAVTILSERHRCRSLFNGVGFYSSLLGQVG